MGLLKVKDEETAVQEPSLAEKIGDNSIEKGLPDLDNPQGKSNMGKVGLFLGLLFATGLVAASLIVFTSGDDEQETSDKNAQAEMVTATQSHNFNQDKSEIQEQESLEMAVASEAQAASEVSPVEVADNPQPTSPEPVETVESQQVKEEVPAEPVSVAEPAPPKLTPYERKLSGAVLINKVSDGGGDNGFSGSLNSGSQDSNPFLAAVAAAKQPFPSLSGGDAAGEKPPQNALAAQLNPTQTPSAKAKNGGSRDFLLAKGTNILCTLDT